MDAKRIRLDLDLDVGSEPVTGELAAPGHHPRSFNGYAGLIAALDALRETGGEAAVPNPHPSSDPPAYGEDKRR